MACSRVARVASHVAPPPPCGWLQVAAGPATANRHLTQQATSSATAGSPTEQVVYMLEPPAEDAVPQGAVESMFATHDLKVRWPASPDQELEPITHRDAVALVTVKKKIDAQVLDRFPALRMVAVAFTGYDHVDLEECRRRGIAVANVPGYSTDAVAELCFGLIFSLLRHIPIAHQHMREGKWSWPAGNELSGKTVGVLGTGQIGMRVAEIAKAFRVRGLVGYSNSRSPRFVSQLGGEYVSSLATLFLRADVVVVAVALTPSTRGLVSRKLLRLLRPDSIIVNCARGAIIDEGALCEMLAEGRFRAGLDVYEVEPLPADHLLRRVPEGNLVTVPHLAYKCHESLRRRQDVTLANILAHLSDNPQNIVS